MTIKFVDKLIMFIEHLYADIHTKNTDSLEKIMTEYILQKPGCLEKSWPNKFPN